MDVPISCVHISLARVNTWSCQLQGEGWDVQPHHVPTRRIRLEALEADGFHVGEADGEEVLRARLEGTAEHNTSWGERSLAQPPVWWWQVLERVRREVHTAWAWEDEQLLTCAGSCGRESIQSQVQRPGMPVRSHLVQNKPWALSGSMGNGESTKVV